MRCLSCNYDLRNLSERRCPECGRAFDPSDVTTFGAGNRLLTLRRVGLIAAFAYLLTLAFIIYMSVTELPGDTRSLLLTPVYAVPIAAIFTFPSCLILYLAIASVVRIVRK